MRTKFSVRVLAEVAIFAAIAFVLDLFQGIWFKGIWASGGSLGIAMVPIFVIAYRRGLIPGILCGLIVSLLQMLEGPYIIQGRTFDSAFLQTMGPFIQVMLDYVLAYTVVGFAGAFASPYAKTEEPKRLVWIVVGTLVGGFLKFLCHFAAGYFWLNNWGSFAGIDDSTMLYSLVYNGTYCIPNMIVCTGIMVILELVAPFLLNPNAEIGNQDEYVEEVKEDNQNEA